MPSKSAISAHYFAKLSGHPDLFERVEQRFCQAYDEGYSVVEISRLSGSRSADYAHAVLVKNGKVRRGKSGKLPAGLDPGDLAPYLKKKKLTFAKWCAGWDFEIADASAAIKNNEAVSVWLEAVARDFPHYIAKKAKAKVSDYVKVTRLEKIELELSIVWDFNFNCYRAFVMNNPDTKGYGPTHEYALKNLKQTHMCKTILARMAAVGI
jgi:hypothetical protein